MSITSPTAWVRPFEWRCPAARLALPLDSIRPIVTGYKSRESGELTFPYGRGK